MSSPFPGGSNIDIEAVLAEMEDVDSFVEGATSGRAPGGGQPTAAAPFGGFGEDAVRAGPEPAFSRPPRPQMSKTEEIFRALARAGLRNASPELTNLVDDPFARPTVHSAGGRLFERDARTGDLRKILDKPDELLRQNVFDKKTGNLGAVTVKQMNEMVKLNPGRFHFGAPPKRAVEGKSFRSQRDPDRILTAVGPNADLIIRDLTRNPDSWVDVSAERVTTPQALIAAFSKKEDTRVEREILSSKNMQLTSNAMNILEQVPPGGVGARGTLSNNIAGVVEQFSPVMGAAVRSFLVGEEVAPGLIKGAQINLNAIAASNLEFIIGQPAGSRVSDQDIDQAQRALSIVKAFSSKPQVRAAIRQIAAFRMMSEEITRHFNNETEKFPVATEEQAQASLKKLEKSFPPREARWLVKRMIVNKERFAVNVENIPTRREAPP